MLNFKNCTHHDGSPLPESLLFPKEAPEEIGALRSAASSLLEGPEGKMSGGETVRKVIYSIVILVGALLFGGLIFHYIKFDLGLHTVAMVMASLTILATLLIIFATQWSEEKVWSYVGQEGISEMRVSRWMGNRVKERTLLFRDAATLQGRTTEIRKNDQYVRTDYSLHWLDENRMKTHRLRALAVLNNRSFVTGKSIAPNLPPPYHYLKAAEKAWNDRRLPEMLARIQSGGAVAFHYSDRIVEICQETICIRDPRTENEITLDDIQEMEVEDGFLTFFSTDYDDINWLGKISGKGKLQFHLGTIDEPKLFLLLVNQFFDPPES